ncbi:class I SAM-dependent methyltransferase [Glycomyces terrestris]|uniref:Class I SAM-dependent methyltransferase n=2 Tax=Glycomyces terrestris TaxID=2493553 RepID=A0A426V5Q0_9ACTN|nr:class I SAM-dependent methyltransferase [Glycomyces terrestris]
MAAERVLDVGCGTGTLLRRARSEGHTGRLAGLDPDPAMLDQARGSDAAEWLLATAAAAPWDGEFDLAVMGGNAFQFLLDDAAVHDSLVAVRRALAGGGRFAFDTRNPVCREWRDWNPDHPYEVTDPAGARLRVHHEASEPDEHGVVAVSTVFAGPHWDRPLTASGALRFTPVERLDGLLAAAGFTVEERYGTWAKDAFREGESRSIITIARA